MNLKLLALQELYQKKAVDLESISDNDIDVLLSLAPKKVDEHFVVTNNSFEILTLLIKLDWSSHCNFNKITTYLLEFFSRILKVKVNNQLYSHRTLGKIEILEFEVIDKINRHIADIMDYLYERKNHLYHQIRHIIYDTFLPVFTLLASKISSTGDAIETNFEKNEVLWLRSFLSLTIKKGYTSIFITESTISTVKEELIKMMKTPIEQQSHDGFYKTGVILIMIDYLELNNVQHLIFISNYCNLLLKKYLKYEEVNQKLLNPFRLSLEVSLLFEEKLSGLSSEGSKILSLRKVLSELFSELQSVIPRFDVKFMADILNSIESVFKRIPKPTDKIKIVDILFSFYVKFRSVSHNVVQILHEHKSLTNTDNKGQVFDKKKKEDSRAKFVKISQMIVNCILKILDTDHFDSEMETADTQNLSYNFVVNIFNSIANFMSTYPQNQADEHSARLTIISNEEKNMHQVKEMGKYQIYGLKFLYKLSKRYKNTTLIYKLISSKFSLKNSLSQLKQIINSIDEKKVDCIAIKLYLQTSMNMSNSTLFQRAMNDLLGFYSEFIQDDKKYKIQEEFVFGLINKWITKADNPEILQAMYSQLTTFMTKIAKDVITHEVPDKHLDYFVKNLRCVTDILKKILLKENSSMHRDSEFIEKLIEIWIYIILHRDTLLKTSLPLLNELALVTPRLVQYAPTSYSNTFLIHPFLKSQKIIDKFRRHYKHIIRDDMKLIDLRPKVRNLLLGEMVFIISLDFILDAKIQSVPINPQQVIEYQKNIPFMEMILCYIRDNYITEKENLKEVLEEFLVRKAKLYIQ